ncbi:MAG: OmpA family protein [Bacteroidetes bacterium]|nr:OmpA family protein [Bacteroidota bacterium]
MSAKDKNIAKIESFKLQELRELILGLEITELQALKNRLDDSDNFAQEVSLIVADAIKRKSHDNSGELSDTLFPIVEESILKSVSRDPNPLAEAMFPIMGPAIRKAISDAFRKMIQSMNQSIENSFSLKSLKWRMESIRTGKSFAEIVMLNNLEYRVSEVFLIHRKTGLLLNHIVANQQEDIQADMVSGMLKAIQDFVLDSFHLDENEELGSIQVGDVNVWIEQGPHVILAAVVQGNVAETYRDVLKNEIENISQLFSKELKTFDGDTSVFDKTIDSLEKCVIQKRKAPKKKKSIVLWILLVIIASLISYWIFSASQKKNNWEKVFNEIDSLPGVVVTDITKHKGIYYVHGLKDPEVFDVDLIYSNFGIDSSDIIIRLENYVSINEEVLYLKLLHKLQLIDDINNGIEVSRGEVLLTGKRSQAFVDSIVNVLPEITGLKSINTEQLEIGYYFSAEELNKKLAKCNVLFNRGGYIIDSSHAEVLAKISGYINEFLNLEKEFKNKYYFEVLGYSDQYGTVSANNYISNARAKAVIRSLINRDILEEYFMIESVTSTKEDVSDSLMRRVSIKLVEIE